MITDQDAEDAVEILDNNAIKRRRPAPIVIYSEAVSQYCQGATRDNVR